MSEKFWNETPQRSLNNVNLIKCKSTQAVQYLLQSKHRVPQASQKMIEACLILLYCLTNIWIKIIIYIEPSSFGAAPSCCIPWKNLCAILKDIFALEKVEDNNTAYNATISSNFLVWKDAVSVEFWAGCLWSLIQSNLQNHTDKSLKNEQGNVLMKHLWLGFFC